MTKMTCESTFRNLVTVFSVGESFVLNRMETDGPEAEADEAGEAPSFADGSTMSSSFIGEPGYRILELGRVFISILKKNKKGMIVNKFK